MWRKRPPFLWFVLGFGGLGPLGGGLIAALLFPIERGLGPDRPETVAAILLWGAYLVGLAPALLTAVLSAVLWRRMPGPLAYLALTIVVGTAVATGVVATVAVASGSVRPQEVASFLAFMAACGAGGAVLPAMVTLPAWRRG